jgi:uncharacterized protein (TIGR02145 family)
MFGRTLKDYSFQSELGHGGMGTVYRFRHLSLKVDRAIKVLKSEYTGNENIRNRFLSEARIMAQMSHPNVVKVIDLIDEGDTIAFVMEYIEGETLKEYLDRKGRLKDDEIKDIFSQMLNAVGYVHQQNLVHRDIKPSNFMMDRSGNIKLLDFGIAKNTDASSAEYTQTGTGAQMGTPMYMSPEQITEPKSVTAQSDIYSLGAVLWQMVTGQKPYDTKTLSDYQLLDKIVKEALPFTRTPWDAVISKATAKDVQARYSSASEFSKALHAENNAPENHDATVVGGGKDKTVDQKGHDETVVYDAPNQKKDISLNERFEQERVRKGGADSQGSSRIKLVLIVGVLVLFSALGYQFFIAGSGSSKAASSKEDKTFKEVKIGNQVWMSENLNVDKFRNGDPIPEAKTEEEWVKAGQNKQPAWCYYDSDPANGEKYGKLYNWYALKDSRGLAPSGYHIPTDEEWTLLTDHLGGEIAGTKMKSTSGWSSNGNGNNSSGFSGLPGGGRGFDGAFGLIGEYGSWWSSSEDDTSFVWLRGLGYCNGDVYRSNGNKETGLSVRCLRD